MHRRPPPDNALSALLQRSMPEVPISSAATNTASASDDQAASGRRADRCSEPDCSSIEVACTDTRGSLVADSGMTMSDVIDPEGFRANVGIVLMRGDGHVFLGRRTRRARLAVSARRHAPGRGARRGRSIASCMRRSGCTRDDVELLGSTAAWLRYRLPPRYVRRNRHPLCIGQKQRWFLLRLKRRGRGFAFDRTSEPEFDEWRWVGLLGAGARGHLFQAARLSRAR